MNSSEEVKVLGKFIDETDTFCLKQLLVQQMLMNIWQHFHLINIFKVPPLVS